MMNNNGAGDSKSNLQAIIQRLISLVHEDLHDLNKLLEKTDSFSLHENMTCIETKRERCLKLLKLLQNASSFENKWRKDDDVFSTKFIDNERLKAADDIMLLLRKNKFIQSSELAEYLKTTLLKTFAIDHGMDYSNNNKKNHHSSHKKEPKSIRKLVQIYNLHKKNK